MRWQRESDKKLLQILRCCVLFFDLQRMQQETRTDPQKRDMEEEEMTTQEAINQLNKMAVTDRDYEAVTVAKEAMTCGEWISVKDRLPGIENEYVLTLVSGKPTENITLENAYELAEFDIDDGWILEMWPEFKNPNVTHWMPLPQPPKESEQHV